MEDEWWFWVLHTFMSQVWAGDVGVKPHSIRNFDFKHCFHKDSKQININHRDLIKDYSAALCDPNIGWFQSILKWQIASKIFILSTRPDLNMTDWFHVSFTVSEELWIPEIIILDMMEMMKTEVMEERGHMRVKGDKTINIEYNMRLSVHCDMELIMYPHDVQVSGSSNSRTNDFLHCAARACNGYKVLSWVHTMHNSNFPSFICYKTLSTVPLTKPGAV